MSKTGVGGFWDSYSVSWSIVEHVGMIFQVSEKFEKKNLVFLVETKCCFPKLFEQSSFIGRSFLSFAGFMTDGRSQRAAGLGTRTGEALRVICIFVSGANAPLWCVSPRQGPKKLSFGLPESTFSKILSILESCKKSFRHCGFLSSDRIEATNTFLDRS